MRVIGVDFTSTPSRRKPVTAVAGTLDGTTLRIDTLETFAELAGFEALLARPGPWIAGCDFPFGQARRFVENVGWPLDWAGYVDHAATLSRAEFRTALDGYRAPRPAGDREHRRATDVAAGAISPQKLYGVPVGLMFHEGVPRLRAAGVTVPGLQDGDPERIVVEAYPGVLARHLIGRRSYKNDVRAKRDEAQRDARRTLLDALGGGNLRRTHGVDVVLDTSLTRTAASGASGSASAVLPADVLVGDPMADRLDALLCAVQAGWSWTRRADRFGEPADADPLEGWIAEPTLGPRPRTGEPRHRRRTPVRSNGARNRRSAS